MADTDDAIYFSSPSEWRKWLTRNHGRATEILVGFHKVKTGRPTMTWAQSVDEALCFGWIDGIRRGVDADRYTIRFTPRKPGSIWSRVNVARVEELQAQGRMKSAGLTAFDARNDQRTGVYSHENATEFDAGSRRALRANTAAWKWFSAQAPSYQRQATHWVMSAKRAETRDKRLATLIADSAAGRRVGPLNWQRAR